MKDFSVIVSIYHKENPIWFREALDCVFAQTAQPNEFVLVEDGELTPELYSVIDEYSHKYPIFKIVKNDHNLGLGLSMNKAVLAASNDIVARMDTDDRIPEDRFEKQLAVINKGYDVVSCWSQLFNSDFSKSIAIKTRPEQHEDIVKLAHKRSPVCHAACMMRKEAILKAGNYQSCLLYEDYHLWIRMIMSGAKFYNIQEVLYYVRTTSDQVKRRSGYQYLKTEMGFFRDFRKKGFFTWNEYFRNTFIRVFARLAPTSLRSAVMKRIWNHKNG